MFHGNIVKCVKYVFERSTTRFVSIKSTSRRNGQSSRNMFTALTKRWFFSLAYRFTRRFIVPLSSSVL